MAASNSTRKASTSALSYRLPPLTVWNVTVCKPVGSITFLFRTPMVELKHSYGLRRDNCLEMRLASL